MPNSDKAQNTDLALKLVLFSAATALFLLAIYELKVLAVIIILAITLASAMEPLARFAEQKKIPRLLTVLVIYLILFACYGLLAVALTPTLCEQWRKLYDNLPTYLTNINLWYQNVSFVAGYNSAPQNLGTQEIQDIVMRLFRQTLRMTAGFIGLVLNTILTLFLSAYFVIKADDLWSSILRWLPSQTGERIRPLILPLASRMGGYVRGQVLVAFCVAAFLACGFALLGVKYAVILGLLAGVLNLVPYVGSFVACAFAVLIAFNQEPWLALAVLLLYGVEQWLESTVMVPLFLGKHTELHPLIVLLAIIIGGTLLGIPGMLISVPIASAAAFLLEEFYLKRLSEIEG